jgi:hypothetical protein
MYHRRKTIKMRQEEQMMLAQDKQKMMQWRHKPKLKADTQHAEKRK